MLTNPRQKIIQTCCCLIYRRYKADGNKAYNNAKKMSKAKK